jgi:hypothetical protein
MKRIYKEHTEWECYKNGMYSPSNYNEECIIGKCIELLSNCEWFFNTSLVVLNKWKISSDVNLSNTSQNRKSWIGQSACSFMFGATELTTRKAWSRLDKDTQDKANLIADKIIKVYESKNRELHQDMGRELLF